MKKIVIFIFILLLAGLVLIGGGCGEEKLDKKLSESEIRYVLNKTAQDLGWSSVNITSEEGKNGMRYEFRHNYESAYTKYITLKITDLLSLENFQDDYAQNACEKTKNQKIEDAVDIPRKISTEIIDLSGFDACYYEVYSNYGKQCKTCASCSKVQSTRTVIGNYWLSIFSDTVEYDKEIACNLEEAIFVAETLAKNLLEVLRQ